MIGENEPHATKTSGRLEISSCQPISFYSYMSSKPSTCSSFNLFVGKEYVGCAGAFAAISAVRRGRREESAETDLWNDLGWRDCRQSS